MNAESAQALEQAAFNVWVSIGDWLSVGSSRAEMRQVYEELGRALEEYKTASK